MLLPSSDGTATFHKPSVTGAVEHSMSSLPEVPKAPSPLPVSEPEREDSQATREKAAGAIQAWLPR
jgi:hypothetical protein